RMEVLRKTVNAEKEQGWKLLIHMLPKNHGIAYPTHRMRWRLFDQNLNIERTRQEVLETHSLVVDLLLSVFDYSESKLAQLVEESIKLRSYDRDRVLSFIENNISEVVQISFETWHAIRKILSQHRSHPHTNWSLSEDILLQYEALYKSLEPNDKIHKYIWLFDDSWPQFPEGIQHTDRRYKDEYDEHQEKIDTSREHGIKEIINEFGIEKIKELSFVVKESWSLGDTLARII